HRHRDAIGVLAGALDIIGRIARSGLEAVEHGEEPVETDGRTIEGSKIESSHGITSWLSEMRMVRPAGRTGLLAQPRGACANPMWGSRGGAKRGKWLKNIRYFREVRASGGPPGRPIFSPPVGLRDPAALL